MINQKDTATLLAFWKSFTVDPLYGTGFSDAVVSCAAHRTETWESERDTVAALAFLAGYAQACRLACDYLTPRWHVAHLLSCAAGVQLAMLGSEYTGHGDVVGMCHTWTAELVHEIGKL